MNLKRNGSSNTGELSVQSNIEAKQQAFLALLTPVLPSLSRFASAMCRNHNGRDPERAKDLVSETILKAFESFDRVREHQAFQSYLFTIAVRLQRDERSKRNRWMPFSKDHYEISTDSENAPDANADIDTLYAALATLPKEQREAIVMSEIVGLKLQEVAEIQHSSLSAVKSRVSRGRMKLAELLGVSEDAERASAESTTLRNNSSANGHNLFHARFAFQAKEKL